VDIRVGRTQKVGAPASREASSGGAVEARILAVRAPRRRSVGPPQRVDRRSGSQARDPVNGRVLVLMIPDKAKLPKDLESGGYRVFLRFARR
jgi:hypothetical protein